MHTELQDIARWIANRLPTDMQGTDWPALQQNFPWYTIPYWLQAAEKPENPEWAAKAAISGGNQFLLHILLQPTHDAIATPTGPAQANAPIGTPPLPPEKADEPAEVAELTDAQDTVVTLDSDNALNNELVQVPPTAEPQMAAALAPKTDAATANIPFEPAEADHKNEADWLNKETANEDLTEVAQIPEAQLPHTNENIEVKAPVEAATSATTQTDSEDYPPDEEADNANPPELGNLNLKGLAKMMHEPVEATDPLAASEPFHTIDYFASQGIKAEKPKENSPSNHFDNQVKSFTEWLKTMKKLHYQPATAYTDPLVEKKARQSLQEGEIVTETMADVWLKQGNFSEAVKIYQKLILIHPEKSHYFAALIKQVNQKL
jgi:hypothetical protein